MTLALPHMALASRQGPFQLPSLGFDKTRQERRDGGESEPKLAISICAGHGFFAIPRSLTTGTQSRAKTLCPVRFGQGRRLSRPTPQAPRSSCSAQHASSSLGTVHAAQWQGVPGGAGPPKPGLLQQQLTSAPPAAPPAAPSNSAQTGGDQPGRKCTEEMPRSLCLAAPRGSFGDPPNKSQKAKRVQIERPQNPKTALARLEFLRIIRRPEPCSSRPLAQDDDAGLSTSLCACAWRLILHTISRRTHHSHTPLLTPPPLPPCPGCPGGPGGPGCFGRVSAELPRGFHRPSIDLHHLHPRPADGPRVAIPLNLLYSRLPDETLDGLQRSCVPASCA